ncbi:hypothetical protein [Streptomyces sp. NPDC051636]|uniref:hypothetical protein n=1 Tax=Streptomyces sp. NPDC051636 TaxID=3365663 RepID=UPI003791DC9C
MVGVPVGRGRTRWGLFAAITAVPVLLVTGLVVLVAVWSRSDYPLGGAPEQVPCAEALAFGGAKPPAGAHGAHCTVQVWLDTDYVARFRMPRDGVRDWLAATYPDAPGPETEFCGQDSVDLCLDLGFTEGNGDYAGQVPGEADPGFGANAVRVEVTYEGPDTALVRFSAFTV